MIHSLISFQYDHPLTGGPIRCSDTSQAALTKKIVIHDKEANMVSNPIPHFLTICKDPHAAPSPLPAPAPCSQRSQRCSHSSSFHTSEKTQTLTAMKESPDTRIASRKRLLLGGKKPTQPKPAPSRYRRKSNSWNSLSWTLQRSSALPYNEKETYTFNTGLQWVPKNEIFKVKAAQH